MNALGRHLLIELRQCDSELLDDIRYVEDAMVSAADQAGATIVGRSFHKFHPRGVTGIVAIAESHLCIHTWPEYCYASLDIFTCGTAFKPEKATQLIIERFRSAQQSITEIERGPLSERSAATV